MAQGNEYHAPSLPLDDNDLLILFQVRNGQTLTTSTPLGDIVGGSGPFRIDPNSLWGNPGDITSGGESITIGDPLSGGVFYSPTINALVGTPATTYYLTLERDASGISGYYTAARVPNTVTGGTIGPFNLPSTTLTTIANFITAPGDPGAIAFPAGNVKHLIYASLGSAGSATVVVQVLALGADGVESSLGTSSPTTLTDTTTTPLDVIWRKQGTTATESTDRLIFRIRAARVSGADPITISLISNITAERPTVSTTVTGTGAEAPGYEVNVMSFGAVGDAKSSYDGVMTIGSANLQSTSTTFKPSDVTVPPKKVHVNGALGVGNPPLIADLIGYVDAHNVTLSAPATSATNGIQSLDGAAVDEGGTSGYYQPNDVVALVGGTFTIQASALVISTRIRPATDTVPAVAIVNAGSLGAPGNYIFQCTSGTGRKAQVRGIVGTTGSLVSLTLFSGGIYVANPGTTAEPITDTTSGLLGATISIAGIDVGSLAINVRGAYTDLPPDPVNTAAGSLSGATGLTIDASWVGTGRFVYGTNDRDAIAAAITAAINLDAGQTRRDVVFPSRMFMMTGAALPVMTAPIRVQGAGRYQTTVFAAEGYGSSTSTHVFGWSDLYPSAQQAPITSALPLISQSEQGAGLIGIEVVSDSTNTVVPDAFLIYDRCTDMYFDDFGAQNVASAFRTGVPLNTTQSMLRESLIKGLYTRNCGTSTRPVIDLLTQSPNDVCNYLTFRDINVVFPRGIGWRIDHQGLKTNGVKEITAYNVRIEQPPSSVFAYNQLQLNSPDSLGPLADIYFENILLVGARPNVSAIALYGASELTRCRNIRFSNYRTIGPVFGTGVQINSGYNISLDGIDGSTARTSQIELGNHSDYRQLTTASSGSTSSTVVTVLGPATDNGNVGAAAVHKASATITCSQTGDVLNVTAIGASPQRIVAGSVISGPGVKWTKRVIQQLTGAVGGVGTYQVSNSQTMNLASRTATFTQTRYVTSYVAGTKTSTIGSCQGSAATWDVTPVSGEVVYFQSLVDSQIYINAFGDERNYVYNLGTGAAALIQDPVLASGDPTGIGLVNRPLAFSDIVFSAVTNTYTASGAILVTDNLALINAAGAAAMTLGSGTTDGHLIQIKRYGAGNVTVTANIDGVGGAVITMNSTTIKENATLAWNAANSTWLYL